jgi:3-isopropylmalate dehydratase small subunit
MPPLVRDEGFPVLDGRAWVFTDFLRAEEIVPPGIKDLGEAVRSLFRDLDRELASQLSRGDVLVGGSELGCGDGGATAARALRRAGIAAVIARSFAAEFAAEALEVGLPTIVIDESQMIRTGDQLRVDIEGRRVVNLSSGDRYPLRELDEEMVEALRAGGAAALRSKRGRGER